MRGMQRKTFFMQWGLPFVFLIIVIIAILVNFSFVGHKQNELRVKENEEQKAEEYAHQFYDELNGMTQSALSIADAMGTVEEQDTAMLRNMLNAICTNSQAYQAVVVNSIGTGYDQNGNKIDIFHEPYFRKDNKEQRYVYVESDGISQRKAIISIIPIHRREKKEKALYVYYPVERFKELFQSFTYQENSFCAFIIDQGKIVASIGENSKFKESNNLYNDLFAQNEDDSVQEAWLAMKGLKTGYFVTKNMKPDMFITYAPIKVNDWYVLIGSDNHRLQRIVKKEWKTMKQIVVQLSLAIAIFMLYVIVMGIINKTNYNKQSRTLELKADTDLLTELYNKMATEREIQKYVENNPNKMALFFLVDIDNFKSINDTKGHAFGDQVLRTLGTKLKTEFRQSDVIGRIGGDEMVIFLKDIPDQETMNRQMQKVKEFYQSIEIGEYVKYKVTASIGVSAFPADGTDFTKLYKEADKAVYQAKENGKNCVYYKNKL